MEPTRDRRCHSRIQPFWQHLCQDLPEYSSLADLDRNKVKGKIYKLQKYNGPRLDEPGLKPLAHEIAAVAADAAEGQWTKQELDDLVRGYHKFGSSFAKIRENYQSLAGRDHNMLKKRFYKLEKEKTS
jgi:hypothetical protein